MMEFEFTFKVRLKITRKMALKVWTLALPFSELALLISRFPSNIEDLTDLIIWFVFCLFINIKYVFLIPM